MLRLQPIPLAVQKPELSATLFGAPIGPPSRGWWVRAKAATLSKIERALQLGSRARAFALIGWMDLDTQKIRSSYRAWFVAVVAGIGMVTLVGFAEAAVHTLTRSVGGAIAEMQQLIAAGRPISTLAVLQPARTAVELGPEPAHTGSPPSVKAPPAPSDDEPPLLAAVGPSGAAGQTPSSEPARPTSRWRATKVGWVPPDPSELRSCEDVYVYIVTDWVDGGAMATIGLGAKARGYPKRVGARVGKYRVAAIGAHPHGLGPTVWLTAEGQTCTALLFDDNPTRVSAAAKRRLAREKAKRNKKKRKRKR